MAKRRHQEPPPASSSATILVLAVGGLAVAGLVVWALTRTVEPPAPVADTAVPISAPAPTATTTPPLTTPPFTATQTTSPFPTTGAVEQSTSSVSRISVEDLREQMRANVVTVIDVRDAKSYGAAHIPGSLHIPFAQMEGEMSTLPKGKPIVTYCT